MNILRANFIDLFHVKVEIIFLENVIFSKSFYKGGGMRFFENGCNGGERMEEFC